MCPAVDVAVAELVSAADASIVAEVPVVIVPVVSPRPVAVSKSTLANASSPTDVAVAVLVAVVDAVMDADSQYLAFDRLDQYLSVGDKNISICFSVGACCRCCLCCSCRSCYCTRQPKVVLPVLSSRPFELVFVPVSAD